MRFVLSFIILLLTCVNTQALRAQSKEETEVAQVIDGWHKAAADHNADAFFGAMADNCMYIGTDETERWTKKEFEAFAKPYFDAGKAWDFKAYNRDLHVTSDGQTVWFSELLTTWMGVCRGSGILTKTKKGWKIEQYHLAVTVPNDIIKDFISLVDSYKMKQKR